MSNKSEHIEYSKSVRKGSLSGVTPDVPPQQSQRSPKNFGELTKDVLQNIFRLGVKKSWPNPYEEDMEDSESTLSSEGDEEERQCFMPKQDRLRRPPALETIMDCAMVCRNWADAVLDIGFWKEHLGIYFGDIPEPWELGRRWNRLFVKVPVDIPCSATLLLSSIGKIEVSASEGRTRFSVYFPVRNKRRENIYKAWIMLRKYLWKHCTHLKLFTRGEEGTLEFGLGDVLFKPWSQLQSLELDKLMGLSWPSIKAMTKLQGTAIKTLRKDPPFPALNCMAFPTHPNGHVAREVLNVAPNIERCEMDTSGFQKDTVPGWDMHRNCISHRMFLEEDKRFRTYVTPFCMLAFKWPGPKKLSVHRSWWKVRSQMSHSPNYGVLVSERRDGKHCELRMTLEDFFAEEDLTELIIPRSMWRQGST